MSADKYTRRALLGRLGGAAAVTALSPFVPYTEAEAAVAAKPRYCYWFTPVNPKASLVDPNLPSSNAEESDLVFRGTYSSLNTMSKKMSLYRGMSNFARQDGDLGGGHRDSWVSMLVGAGPSRGNVAAGGTNLGDGCGIGAHSSIDQWIAQEILPKELKVNTPLRDIRFGWEHEQDGLRTVSFYKGAQQLRDGAPSTLFAKMFPFSGGNGGGVSQAYKKNILDYVYADVKRMQGQLTSNDKQRLDAHLQAIDEVQRVIAAAEGGGSCDLPQTLGAAVVRLDQAVSAFSKLTAIAFNCDLTRVAGGQFLPYQGGDGYHKVTTNGLNTLGAKVNATWHSATHDKGGSAADVTAFIKGVQEYRCKMYLDLINELDKFKEPGGGTLLDSSIVHWYIEISKDHKISDLFNLIAGGAGYFKMGKQFIVGDNTGENRNAPQNMLLTSIGRAMGGATLSNFGDAKYNKGPIPSKYLMPGV
jgi:hypothetical protein